MKRYSVIKNFTNLLKDNDIVIFSGKNMCKEAYQYDKPGYFYIDDTFGLSVSFALGIAMSTDKRVFVFVGEGDLQMQKYVCCHFR
jgi:thiamine pyrophosphate-dependent acetolactate synthase large subunit-like protein